MSRGDIKKNVGTLQTTVQNNEISTLCYSSSHGHAISSLGQQAGMGVLTRQHSCSRRY